MSQFFWFTSEGLLVPYHTMSQFFGSKVFFMQWKAYNFGLSKKIIPMNLLYSTQLYL